MVGSWEKSSNFIPAFTDKTIETIPLADFHSLDFIFTLYNDTENLSKRIHLNIIKEGTTLSTNVSGKLGRLPNIAVTASVLTGDAIIAIFNNNAYQIELNYVKLSL